MSALNGGMPPRIDDGIHDIAVIIPEGTDADPEQLFTEHGNWVLEKKATYDRYRAEAPYRQFEEVESFPYQGDEYELVVEQRSVSQIEDGNIRLAKHHVIQTSIKQALEQLYRRKPRKEIEDTIEKYSEEMDIEYHKLEIRNQRTKWAAVRDPAGSGSTGD